MKTQSLNGNWKYRIGKGAESMIALEKKEQKYNIEKHKARLHVIVDNWDNIKQIFDEELPSFEHTKKCLNNWAYQQQ